MITEVRVSITVNCYAKNNNGDVHAIDVVEGKSMTEALSKLLLVVSGLQEKIGKMKEQNEYDDSIPF